MDWDTLKTVLIYMAAAFTVGFAVGFTVRGIVLP